MVKHLLVDFQELSHLLIGCPKCSTRILFDCTDREPRIPTECPGCGFEYDGAFRSTLQTYREVYRKLSDPQGRHVEVRLLAGPE